MCVLKKLVGLVTFLVLSLAFHAAMQHMCGRKMLLENSNAFTTES